MDKLELLCTVSGHENGITVVENSMAIPQKTKHRITILSSNSTSGYMPKRIENKASRRYLYSNVPSSILHSSKRWKQPKCPSTQKWKRKYSIYLQGSITEP